MFFPKEMRQPASCYGKLRILSLTLYVVVKVCCISTRRFASIRHSVQMDGMMAKLRRRHKCEEMLHD